MFFLPQQIFKIESIRREPRLALPEGRKLFCRHAQDFGLDEGGGSADINDNLFKGIDELELSVRATNCLRSANIATVGELVQRPEAEMLKTKNFGKKSLDEIKAVLESMGLDFGMKIDNFEKKYQEWKRKQHHEA